MLLVFPFEEAIYKNSGVRTTYVGHPLAGVIPMKPDTAGARKALGIDDGLPVVTVMPGPRPDEIDGCSDAFFGAVEKIMHRVGDMHVLVPAANDQARAKIIFNSGLFPRVASRIKIVVGESHRMIEAADAVLCASGTAALECALFKKPLVVGYKMPALTGMIMQKKALIRHVSLPNILLGDNVVPEFLQYFCEADWISYALEDALTTDAKRRELEVNIPAGIDDRQVISVRGEGSMGSNGGPSGDLHVSVFVRPHPFFEREGYNIWYDCKVNFVQAALGDSIMVPTIDGKVKFDLPAGTQPGTVMSLKGKGIQYLNSRGRGDQYIRIIVEVPKDLTAPQREALKNFKDTMGYSDVTPDEKRGFFGKKKK